MKFNISSHLYGIIEKNKKHDSKKQASVKNRCLWGGILAVIDIQYSRR